jgi:DNA-binding protein
MEDHSKTPNVSLRRGRRISGLMHLRRDENTIAAAILVLNFSHDEILEQKHCQISKSEIQATVNVVESLRPRKGSHVQIFNIDLILVEIANQTEKLIGNLSYLVC